MRDHICAVPLIFAANAHTDEIERPRRVSRPSEFHASAAAGRDTEICAA